MTSREYAHAAIDIVIDIAAEQGLKYRRGDFCIVGLGDTYRVGLNIVNFIGGAENPTGISVALFFNFERTSKRLKAIKDNFFNYKYCRVMETGVYFTLSLNDIEIQTVKEAVGEYSKIEKVIQKVQKLLALANNNPSEGEAIAASMQAQKLLAKYNLEIADVTGEEKKENIEQVIADVGAGKKWKYTLAEAIAESYCCKCYYHGAEQIVFYGYQSDVLIARRVYMYLFKVGHSLATKYVKTKRDSGALETKGVYNSFCSGFCHGVKSELQKNCKALMLVTPKEVSDSFTLFSENFKRVDNRVDTTDWNAYGEGTLEGRRALNAQYIEEGKNNPI